MQKIYCDMDGVLVDFEKGYHKLTGIDLKGVHTSGRVFWEPINKAGHAFWSELEWMQDGKDLWSFIAPYNPILLSAPSRSLTSRSGKQAWVKRELPQTKLILRDADKKKEFANPYTILIDDREPNIEGWIEAGGIGILHTSTEQTIKELQVLMTGTTQSNVQNQKIFQNKF
jgi:hypothetical protein